MALMTVVYQQEFDGGCCAVACSCVDGQQGFDDGSLMDSRVLTMSVVWLSVVV